MYYVPLLQEIERQKEREKLRQIEWENTHRELVGNLPSSESFAESVVARVESLPGSPASGSRLIPQDSARAPVVSIDRVSATGEIHRGSSHGPAGHIPSSSVGSTHPDPSQESVSPMDSISSTGTGQRGPSHIGPRSSSGQIPHHMAPLERTVSADQGRSIHSVRDPAETVRPTVAGPSSVPQSATDSVPGTSQLEEEPSLMSIGSESRVSSHISAFSVESADNFETGSEYSGADQ